MRVQIDQHQYANLVARIREKHLVTLWQRLIENKAFNSHEMWLWAQATHTRRGNLFILFVAQRRRMPFNWKLICIYYSLMAAATSILCKCIIIIELTRKSCSQANNNNNNRWQKHIQNIYIGSGLVEREFFILKIIRKFVYVQMLCSKGGGTHIARYEAEEPLCASLLKLIKFSTCQE